MKRTISKMLGIAALAILGSGLFVVPASAAPLRTSTNGGITCGEYTRGAGFPATYWDCITPATNTSNAVAAANAANGLPTAVKNVLLAQNTQIFLFDSNAAYVSYSGGSVSTGVFGAVRGPMTLPGYADVIRMAAIYKTATIAGTPTSMTSFYAGNIKQQLGRIHGPLGPVNLKSTDPFFLAALEDDILYLSNTGATLPDYPSSATVWGATIAAAYPGKSPWEILALRYNVAFTDPATGPTWIYGLQVGRQGSTPTEAALNTFLQSYMQTTRNWVSQQVYAVNPKPYLLNGNVLCVQQNGSNNFPLIWYACARPYTPSAAALSVNASAHTLKATWQTSLLNAGVQVFVMRNIESFKDFDTRWPGFYTGVLGFSTHTGIKRSAAFQEQFLDETHTDVNNAPTYMTGTILHELGHQMDVVVWGNISTANSAGVLGSIRWQTAVNADIAAFNALPCGIALDVDRAAASLPLVCGTKPAGTSNFAWLGSTALPGSTGNFELWARAFNRRAGGTIPQYPSLVQERLGSNMHTYMNDLWSTGAPHN
ncbi:MAG: hypothetical protein C0464_02260 [Cyanobacteria bacterium DS2.008]|nr:hypothetical protein [Cyanobacteria bacterium DS2.008]